MDDPGGVSVEIDDRLIIKVLNTPGGGVFEWRDKAMNAVADHAFMKSPVNNPLNAVHRNGVVGTYKKGWGYDRRGSNGHDVRATIYNTAPHADIVEYGRRGTSKYQRFSWTKWKGEIRSVGGPENDFATGTRGRPGKHILRNAANAVMPGLTGGTYTPLA